MTGATGRLSVVRPRPRGIDVALFDGNHYYEYLRGTHGGAMRIAVSDHRGVELRPLVEPSGAGAGGRRRGNARCEAVDYPDVAAMVAAR
jgi:hypothetical protein